jgi:NAD(P)-dependent dehydrogenase (short-subunit alcohol dehydrogenase family)
VVAGDDQRRVAREQGFVSAARRVAQPESRGRDPRAGTANEVAAAILWLLSEQASYITGTNLRVSGGR